MDDQTAFRLAHTVVRVAADTTGYVQLDSSMDERALASALAMLPEADHHYVMDVAGGATLLAVDTTELLVIDYVGTTNTTSARWTLRTYPLMKGRVRLDGHQHAPREHGVVVENRWTFTFLDGSVSVVGTDRLQRPDDRLDDGERFARIVAERIRHGGAEAGPAAP